MKMALLAYGTFFQRSVHVWHYLKLETGRQPEGHAATTFSNILFLDYMLLILMAEKAIWLDIALSTIK